MTDLAQRVLDAIEKSEQAANAMVEVYPEPWCIADRGGMARVAADEPSFHTIVHLDQHQAPEARWLGDVLQHVILNGPKAVLRRCAADRKLVALCLEVRHGGDENAQDWMASVLPLLARSYGITEEDE